MSIQIYKCDHIGLFIIPARFSLRNNTRTIHDNGLFIMFSIKYKNVYLSPFSKTSYGYHGYHWAPLADYRPTLNPRGGEGKKTPSLTRFPDSVKTAARSAANFLEPIGALIRHLVTRNEGQGHHSSDVSDVTLMSPHSPNRRNVEIWRVLISLWRHKSPKWSNWTVIWLHRQRLSSGV